MSFQLPKLAYNYNALEPYIDAKTMEIHYTKHHATYIEKLKYRGLKALGFFDPSSQKLTNSFILLKSCRSEKLPTKLSIRGLKTLGFSRRRIKSRFGTFESFKEKFSNKALTHFGSGWGWLVVKNHKLDIISTPNQDSPIMKGDIPILGIDVWEHAYYLKYQNRRADYINAWWNVVNWNQVEKNYDLALKT